VRMGLSEMSIRFPHGTIVVNDGPLPRRGFIP
jgi:hypothetical protein